MKQYTLVCLDSTPPGARNPSLEIISSPSVALALARTRAQRTGRAYAVAADGEYVYITSSEGEWRYGTPREP